MGDSTARRLRRVLTAAPAVALVGMAAACGGGGLKQDVTTSTTRAATTTTAGAPASTQAGSGVGQAQNQLNALGCDAGTADGALGAQTTAAITRFQTAAGITADGVLGPATQLKLAEAAQKGSPRCGGTTPTTTGTSNGSKGPSPP